MLTCTKNSRPLSVNIRHLIVCSFEITEPSSTRCTPASADPPATISEAVSFEIFSANTRELLPPSSSTTEV